MRGIITFDGFLVIGLFVEIIRALKRTVAFRTTIQQYNEKHFDTINVGFSR